MTKATVSKMSDEDAAYIAGLEAKEASQNKPMPMMKQLSINEDWVNDKGEKIEANTWTIRGESIYSDTVDFQPLFYKHKFIRMVQDGKRWKTENESIFVSMPWDNAYDANGTIACGRIVGKTPDNWTESQKLANFKKATLYGFMFGLVTFPGNKPELVNFRAAPGKAKVIRTAMETIGDTKLYHVPFKFKLSPPPKGEKFPAFTIDVDLKKVNTDITTLIPYIKECESYINLHNDRLMDRRKSMETRLLGAQTYKEVRDLASDFDDEIPFGGEGLAL